MRVVPQAFYENPKVDKILVDGWNCIIYKSTKTADLDNQRLLSSHAITVVLNGALSIHTDEGLPIKVKEGEGVLLPKGLYLISDILPKEKAFEAMVFFFDDALIAEFLKGKSALPASENLPHSPRILSPNAAVELLIQQLREFHSAQSLPKALTRIKLMEFLTLMQSLDASGTFESHLASLMSKPKRNLSRFMEESFDKPLDVEDFAQLSGRSVSTFRRDFIRQFGMSPKRWLIEKRLQRAKELLVDENHSISTVSAMAGYTDVPHFIKAFHKQFQVSPKQFQLQSRTESSF